MRCLRGEREREAFFFASSSEKPLARSLERAWKKSRLSSPQVSLEAHSSFFPHLSLPLKKKTKKQKNKKNISRLRRPRHLPRPRPLRGPQARPPRPVRPALGLRHRRLLADHRRGRAPGPDAVRHVLHRRARVRRDGVLVLAGRAGPARGPEGAPRGRGPRGDDQRHREPDAGVALRRRDVWRARRQPVLGLGRVPVGRVRECDVD